MTHTRYAFVKASRHADVVSQSVDDFLVPARPVDLFDAPGAFEFSLRQYARGAGRIVGGAFGMTRDGDCSQAGIRPRQPKEAGLICVMTLAEGRSPG